MTDRQNCILTFPLAPVLAAAEHAAAARAHRLPYGQTEPKPQLWWVKDDGTHLTSNGTPHPDDVPRRDGRPSRTVHADGWGPGTDARSLLGGDDFNYPLDLLTREDGDDVTLLGLLRDAVADGATRFLLHVTWHTDGVQLSMSTQ